MGMTRVLLALVTCTLFGQESTNAVPRNDAALSAAATGAIKRVIAGTANWQPVLIAAPVNRPCAVPLQEMRVEKDRKFTGRIVPAPVVEPMPLAQVPAPACAQ